MYTDFFGLEEKPFALVPDPRYLFLGSSHREALAHLLYGIEQGEGFIEVVGQIGTGKTTLCRTLLERVGPDVEVAFIFNPSGSEIELLSAISREFGLPTAARSRAELIEQLNRFLLEKKAAGRRSVLVIDEAQYLEPEVLEQVRLLSNLETEREKLIQIVLIGQPELDDNLARPDMRQLRQRVTVRWQLDPFTRAEVRDYLEHRLRVAGLARAGLFTPGAVRAIYRASGGVPRLINAVADRALLAGYSQGRPRIDAWVVRIAVRELPLRRTAGWREATGLPVGAAALLLACGLLIGLEYVAWDSPRDAPAPLPPVGSHGPDAAAPAEARPGGLPLLQLEHAMSGVSRGDSAAQALNALVRVWGYDAVVGGEIEPEDFATIVGEFSLLRVVETHGTVERLRRIDLPAILELRQSGRTAYAALVGLGADGSARLVLGPGRFDLGRPDLDRLWTGRTFYLWSNFERLPVLASGMSSSAVDWLQDRLTDLGYLQGGQLRGELDGRTEEALRSFQTAYALEETGQVDPETLMALYQALHYEAPSLFAPREDS